jgi:hypothetical protein
MYNHLVDKNKVRVPFRGEVYYEGPMSHIWKKIYFINQDLFYELKNELSNSLLEMQNSNAFEEWKLLIDSVNKAVTVNFDDIDFGNLYHYTRLKPNPNPVIYNFNIIQSVNQLGQSLYEDMKRLCYQTEVTYWGNQNNLVISFDNTRDDLFEIDLGPILELISLHGKKIDSFKIRRIENNPDCIRVQITVF